MRVILSLFSQLCNISDSFPVHRVPENLGTPASQLHQEVSALLQETISTAIRGITHRSKISTPLLQQCFFSHSMLGNTSPTNIFSNFCHIMSLTESQTSNGRFCLPKSFCQNCHISISEMSFIHFFPVRTASLQHENHLSLFYMQGPP